MIILPPPQQQRQIIIIIIIMITKQFALQIIQNVIKMKQLVHILLH
eukprot:UN10115